MIDQFFQSIAEQIHGVLLPGINRAISNAIFNSTIQEMSTDEIQIACIKLALKALALVFIIWIGRILRSSLSAKKREKKIKTKIHEKLWTPDGWYWDDKKGKWVGPDFPQNKK